MRFAVYISLYIRGNYAYQAGARLVRNPSYMRGYNAVFGSEQGAVDAHGFAVYGIETRACDFTFFKRLCQRFFVYESASGGVD